MKNFITFVCCNLLLLSLVWFHAAQSQAPNRNQQFEQQLKTFLAEPFKGLTTDGKIQPGLFKGRSTGVSTQPVRKAAEALLTGLNDEQRKRTLFAVNDDEWRKWDNRHFPPRQGVSFKEMTEAQRQLAFGLFKASLSAKGLKKTQDTMKLNGTLAELMNDYNQYGEWLYFITIMGTPSDKQPWGWQLDGHHCIINYFVLGDQVVMTPNFMGSEPVRAEGGKFKGTVILQDEQDKGFKFFAALSKEQQAKAVINGEKKTNNNLTEAYKDNVVMDYAGIPAAQLNAAQKTLLLDLIAEYVGNLDDGHAKVKLTEVRQHLDKTYFAWIGGSDPQGVFYYRIQSPVILIEFDHQRPVALARTPEPVRYHIHTVVRTPNGNDYGKDLLRQHYERFPHNATETQR
ncbi:MAG: DUF3500 domain-containing protein [Acidobacteria bacterium]|nr:DUF3500 domain-containing protein [Acidobacteriota bacterium]MBI3422546.1 DUF3500 domain-containing protein [Acidobacteriota bacterium]